MIKAPLLIISSSTFFILNAGASLPTDSSGLAAWATLANSSINSNASKLTQTAYNPYSQLGSQAININATSSMALQPRGTKALYNPSQHAYGDANFTCVSQAAYDHRVPLRFMLAINSIERGRSSQRVTNSNGSNDIGQFQINTIHLSRFAKYGATENDIASRGCYNAQVAARLLSIALNEPSKANLDIFTRAAGYHSWTPKYNKIYKLKLIKYLKEWDVWLRVNKVSPRQSL